MKGFSRTSLFAMRQFYAFSAHGLKLTRSLWDKCPGGMCASGMMLLEDSEGETFREFFLKK